MSEFVVGVGQRFIHGLPHVHLVLVGDRFTDKLVAASTLQDGETFERLGRTAASTGPR